MYRGRITNRLSESIKPHIRFVVILSVCPDSHDSPTISKCRDLSDGVVACDAWFQQLLIIIGAFCSVCRSYEKQQWAVSHPSQTPMSMLNQQPEVRMIKYLLPTHSSCIRRHSCVSQCLPNRGRVFHAGFRCVALRCGSLWDRYVFSIACSSSLLSRVAHQSTHLEQPNPA